MANPIVTIHMDDGFHPDRLAGCSCSRRHHDEGYGRGVNPEAYFHNLSFKRVFIDSLFYLNSIVELSAHVHSPMLSPGPSSLRGNSCFRSRISSISHKISIIFRASSDILSLRYRIRRFPWIQAFSIMFSK